MIGKTLAHYRITSAIGAGGMGEVWRAEDTKLGRRVALKLLPEAVAKDPERLARFEREAKVLASLNHPNIATLYGVETIRTEGEGTTTFLVMELVEGEELSARLDRGAIPVREAVGIAREIAEALEASHEQGIVHRDLKPANVKIAEDGTVKVLDFGLAKAWETDAGGVSSSFSPTITRQATLEGVILGTAGYMSPEQARGKRLDRRADVWAFGVVLWEMLTGRRLFEGETVSDVLAAVLTKEPDLAALPQDAPTRLRELIARCLRRDPRKRMRDMGDVRLELEEILEGKDEAPSPEARPPRRPVVSWAVAAAFAVLAIALGALALRTPQPTARGPVRMSVVLPKGLALAAGEAGLVAAISPGGDSIVLLATDGQRKGLYRRALGSAAVVPIEGAEEGKTPFFSPDGRWVGFTSRDDKLSKVSIEGGQPVPLADAGWGGGSWGEDGTIVYTPFYVDGLWRVAADGGTPEELTKPDPEAGELNHSWPEHVPGTNAVLFTSFRLPLRESRVEVLDLGTKERRVLVENALFGRYARSGHLLFVRDGAVHAAPFDRKQIAVTGGALPVLKDAFVSAVEGNSQFSVSSDGTLVHVPTSVLEPPRQVIAIDRAGNENVLVEADRRYAGPVFSPDGGSIALTVFDASPDVWVLGLARRTLTRVTHSPRSEMWPVWHPDGKRLAFVLDAPPFQIWEIAADGSAPPVEIYSRPYDCQPEGYTPDGRFLLIRESGVDHSDDLVALPRPEGGEPTILRKSPFGERLATVSPDGRWVAYESSETGRSEIYVQTFPGAGERVQVTRDGGWAPVWRKSGEIFFWHDGRLWAVRVRTAPTLEIGEPAALFPVARVTGRMIRDYDVSADGERFVTTRVPAASQPREISVVLGWTEELGRRPGAPAR